MQTVLTRKSDKTDSALHFVYTTYKKISVYGMRGKSGLKNMQRDNTPLPCLFSNLLNQATHFCFSFRCFKKASCPLLAKVCARSTG